MKYAKKLHEALLPYFNAYTQFMQSDTIVRTLPIWAQSVGLEME